MEESNQSWYEQLAKYIADSGKSIGKSAKEVELGATTLREYVSGKKEDLNKISDVNKYKLYKLTGLDIFRVEGMESLEKDKIDYGKATRQAYDIERGVLDGSLDALVSQMGGFEKFRSGLLKSQRSKPSIDERVCGVMEILDFLAEELDYFRYAEDEEKRVLAEEIQTNPESFSYATQILNILYSGKNLNSWMMHSQPPSRIKKLGENKNG